MVYDERASLVEFLNNYNSGAEPGGEFSKKYIEDGVVEIQYSGGHHASNGLLITNDGYFFTCGHCVEPGIKDKKVILADGSVSLIDRVCSIDITHDIALCKAKLDGTAQARYYKYLLYLADGQRQKASVELITRKQDKIVAKPGYMYNRLMDVSYWTPVTWQIAFGNWVILSSGYRKDERYEHIRLGISAIPGDSGGIIVLPTGHVAGLLSVSITNTPGFFNRKMHYASAARIIDAISLVSSYLGK